jgi:hypothetical protein
MTSRTDSRIDFWNLFLASFGALFFEMLLVRWLPTTIYYLGYYKNCILFATFLGFGCGAATWRRVERILPYFLFGVAAVVLGAVLTEHYTDIIPLGNGEYVFNQARNADAQFIVPLLLPLLVVFTASALLMVPLGRLVGKYLDCFAPLKAYSINIAASLLGVVTFLAVSYLRLDPTVWFFIATIPILYFVRSNRAQLAAALAGLLLTVGIIQIARAPREYWSPYSKITLSGVIPPINVRLLSVNNNGHQALYDLSAARLAAGGNSSDYGWSMVEIHKYMYESAYAIAQPHSVLIVGGGTGNEAAAALRRGAQKVDVVEIDPSIIEIGRAYHPEQPYRDPRIRIINDDARHYLSTTDQRYDLVVFGFLDSLSNLSSMAHIRLDNYVYTVESLRQARLLLNPNGLLEVMYQARMDFIRLRIYLMLQEVFGQPPLEFQLATVKSSDALFFAGPAVSKISRLAIPGLQQGSYSRIAGVSSPPLATDDWPYLNLPDKSIGQSYIVGLGSMIIISLLFIRWFVWSGSATLKGAPSALCFFLQGAGFMLIETNTITRMALVLGSTWVVTSVAVILVLLAALVANFIVEHFRIPSLASAIGVVAVMTFANYIIDPHFYLSLPGAIRVPLAALQVYLPILASSLVFGRLFQRSEKSSYDLAMNILGAMFGGMLEYTSLIVGTSAVYLIAMLLFLALAAVQRWSQSVSVLEGAAIQRSGR